MNFTEPGWAILRSSGQASILIVVVLAIQWLLSSRIPAAWRYVLWLPVVLRLLLPITPESRFSLFNLFARTPEPVPHYHLNVRTFPGQTIPMIPDAESFPEVRPERKLWRPSGIEIAGGAWMGLTLLLLARSIRTSWKFGKSLRQCQSIEEGRVRDVFENARRDLGVTQNVCLVEHGAIGSPALFGAVWPRLLLPPGLGERFSDRELRHIFLHELAHVKRGDLYMNWLLVVVQALHWFNPLVWYACRRVRADREFACDAMALNCANESEPVQFGETMVKVLETFSGSRRLMGTISVVQDSAELKRRIRMIAAHRPVRKISIFSASLLIGICVVGLSDAQTRIAAEKPEVADGPKKGLDTNAVSHLVDIQAKNAATNSSSTDLYSQVFRVNGVGDYKLSNEADSKVIWNSKGAKTENDLSPLVHNAEADSAIANDLQWKMSKSAQLARNSVLVARVKSTTLDEFSVPTETALSEVIKILSEKVKNQDPTGHGINFIITSSGWKVPSGPNNPGPVDDYKIKISHPLKNVPLMDVLEAIKNGVITPEKGAVARPLEYALEDYAIVFFWPLPGSELYTRTFKLNTDAFLRAVRSRIRMEDSISPKSVQAEVKEFFASVGLDFPKVSSTSGPEQISLFYNDRTGVLLVRATLSELDVIEDVVRQTQSNSPNWRVKVTMGLTATKPGSKRSAVEQISDLIASYSPHMPIWKTNLSENVATIVTTVLNDQDSKALFKIFKGGDEFSSITKCETTIPSGSEVEIAIGSDASPSENKGDVRLIPTLINGDSVALSVGFESTDLGHVLSKGIAAPPANSANDGSNGTTFSPNAIGYVTRKILTTSRFPAGETLVLCIPRVFQEGKDMILFLTPKNQGAKGL